MRRLVFGFGIFLLLLSPANDCQAQKMIDKAQINQRIHNLRNRLKDYHTRFQTPQQKKAEKLKKISEELEKREDVAVTVLFTDPEAGKSNACFEPEVNSDNGSAETVAQFAGAGNAETARTATKSITDNESLTEEQKSRLLEIEKRKKLFARLREKVQQATRGSKKSAKDIRSLVASID
ncbi:MAG: hypothetical protein ACQETH_12265 [Candidatus Rifleibacteriota bacterium]